MSTQTNRCLSRRDYFKTFGAGAVGVLTAGCTGGGQGEGGTESQPTTVEGAITSTPEPILLRMAVTVPEGDPTNKHVIAEYQNLLEERSNGRIRFDNHWSGSLGNIFEGHELLKQGSVDLATYLYPFDGASTRHSVLEMPAAPGDTCHSAMAQLILTFGGGFLQEELHNLDLHVATVNLNPPSQLLTTENVGQISQIDDFQGLVIRSDGAITTSLLQELDAQASEIAPAELYQAADRGTVDGAVSGSLSVETYNWGEVMPYATRNLQGTRIGAYSLAMNLETYQSLPDDIQSLHDRTALEVSINHAHYVPELDQTNWDVYIEDGGERYKIPEGVNDELSNIFESVREPQLEKQEIAEEWDTFASVLSHISSESDGCPETPEELLEVTPSNYRSQMPVE